MKSHQDKAPKRAERDRVVIFDTTLRDGEQCPGATMTFEEKLEVADVLDEMGVDIIEAGFPIASPGRLRGGRRRSPGASRRRCVCGLRARRSSRTSTAPARRCKPAAAAAHPHLHRHLADPSQVQAAQDGEDEVLELVTATVTRARNFTDDVEWSAMDATRTELDFLCRCVEAAIKAGATTINIPDTVGYATPEEYARCSARSASACPDADKAVFSVHCHNDLGLAVANSLAGVGAGARQVECTINGIGERAGNAALEEIVMAIKTRGDAHAVLHRHRRHAC